MHENKKICKKCKRRRKLGKFGKLSSSPDGKNIYCRDCMKEIRNKYKKTPKGIELQKKSVETYQQKNKQRLKEYYRKYYLANKKRILYNIKTKKETKSILIFENQKKTSKIKINKNRQIDTKINPKRKNNE